MYFVVVLRAACLLFVVRRSVVMSPFCSAVLLFVVRCLMSVVCCLLCVVCCCVLCLVV